MIARRFLPRALLEYLKIYFRVLLANERFYKDQQCPLSLSLGGDAALDAVLEWTRPAISRLVGLELAPTYSYTRVYAQGERLTPHTDREACEVSATVSIVVPEGVKPSAIHFRSSRQRDTRVELCEGDACIYSGTDLKHWREPFEVGGQIQLFLHFVDRNGKHFPSCVYDGRRYLGAATAAAD